VAAVTAQENAVLLRHGGADAVVASKSTAGRMLGLAARQPQVGEVVDDLMTIGDGLDIAERAVLPAEIGRPPQGEPGSPVIGVIREGRLLRLGTPECAVVQEGDRIVELRPGGPVAPGQDLGPAVSG
jgi:voltage-gated potassium channel